MNNYPISASPGFTRQITFNDSYYKKTKIAVVYFKSKTPKAHVYRKSKKYGLSVDIFIYKSKWLFLKKSSRKYKNAPTSRLYKSRYKINNVDIFSKNEVDLSILNKLLKNGG